MTTLAEKAIEMGGKIWEKEGMKRVYISQEIFNKITDFGYRLNESKHKFYIDMKDDCIYRRTGNKRPTFEFKGNN